MATASQSLGSLETAVFNAGADPVGYSTAAVSGVRDARVFGTRAMAREMLGISGQPPPRLSGLGVNVVIVDRGLNKEAIDRLERDNWGDGFDVAVAHRDGSERQVVKAGLAPLDSHGMMIARNVLDIVPMAKLYDAPLLPPLIAEPRIFASTANATYRAILDKIEQQRRQSGANTPWIIVNAWAIFDRSTEWPPGDYTQNRHFGIEVRRSEALTVTWGHPLNMIIEEAIRSNVDVVFGAGNCGQFSTSLRCGQRDRGPGCSIWGANGHPSVVTVGAVSTDGAWMGYSSEGPAQWSVHRSDALNEVEIKKPDIVAPSQFREDKDASLVNSGTSAAAGLAAGVIAAIRSTKDHHWGPNELAPLDLKDAMLKTARGGGGGWNPRVGHGILHLPGLIEELERRDQGIRIDQA